MNPYSNNKVFIKMNAVIESCVTKEHYIVAKNFIDVILDRNTPGYIQLIFNLGMKYKDIWR